MNVLFRQSKHLHSFKYIHYHRAVRTLHSAKSAATMATETPQKVLDQRLRKRLVVLCDGRWLSLNHFGRILHQHTKIY